MARTPRCTCPRNHFVPNINCPVHGEAAKRWRDQQLTGRDTHIKDLTEQLEYAGSALSEIYKMAAGWSLDMPGARQELLQRIAAAAEGALAHLEKEVHGK